jgi:hypothetical protein
MDWNPNLLGAPNVFDLSNFFSILVSITRVFLGSTFRMLLLRF